MLRDSENISLCVKLCARVAEFLSVLYICLIIYVYIYIYILLYTYFQLEEKFIPRIYSYGDTATLNVDLENKFGQYKF